MIKSVISRSKSVLFIFMGVLAFLGNDAYSQEEKIGARLTVEHVKVMNENTSLKITAIFKGEEGYEPAQNLNFTIYKINESEVDSEEISEEDSEAVSEEKIGNVTTNQEGKASFVIPSKFVSPLATYSIRIENSDTYEDDEEEVTVMDAILEASVEEIDSVYQIKARFVSIDNEPLAEQTLQVGLKRLFGSLTIGEDDRYETDEDGAILVPIQDGLTGVDGKLTFQVTLKENDDYGTIIAFIKSDIGVPVKDESTFHQRTLWSPPTKTPIFLLIVPNIILIGIWGILVLLVINLFKIYKSKN
ncbi:MAG: hypothetical protein JJE07_07340 [Flavobacteriaceae bacterium]|nr:hypothetical protein [Flavobacteriaceae bacterium]